VGSSEQESFNRTGSTVGDSARALEYNLYCTRGETANTATANTVYMTLAYTVRDYLIDRFRANPKRAFSRWPAQRHRAQAT
jgi:hypothetical protein